MRLTQNDLELIRQRIAQDERDGVPTQTRVDDRKVLLEERDELFRLLFDERAKTMRPMGVDSPDVVRRRESELLEVALWYPRLEGHAKTVQLWLSDVRAADDIRVTYDFDRDGWSIQQDAYGNPHEEHVEDWQEVAFVKAWARTKGTPPELRAICAWCRTASDPETVVMMPCASPKGRSLKLPVCTECARDRSTTAKAVMT